MNSLGLCRGAFVLAAVLGASGCTSEDSPSPKQQADASHAAENANDSNASQPSSRSWQDAGSSVTADAAAAPALEPVAAKAAECDASRAPSVLGIASASLQGKAPIQLAQTAQLLGEGLDLTLMPQQNVAGSLRWRGDRLFVTADVGFWEIPPQGQGEPRFYPTASVILWGLRAGDLDRDGDQDLIVLTLEPNTGNAPTPFGSRLTTWERTPDGLAQRSAVMHTTEMRFAMPYVLGDVDADRDLDVITFEEGAPVAFIHDGAFSFSRQVLGEAAPELREALPLMIDYSDRNADGHADLLLILGDLAAPLTNSIRVLLAEGPGRFGAPGPATMGETPLVPHGPDGVGLGIADVTGDGVADVLQQDDQSTESEPEIRFYASAGAQELAAPVLLKGLGFELADVDEDGKLDIVSSLNNRLIALLARGAGAFESRDLGVSIAGPDVVDYVVDPGAGSKPAALHALYRLRDCPSCDDACRGRCLFHVCIGCLSDADCDEGRCEANTCK